ncbi:DUF6671 family protein [Legionella yabuuchiae]|uniref:DUF6671 family protein n=1 Tax=Legionella yabuuchiae TaxID=376727 RepID=UPI001055E91D|nr:DUF6671 family protein [Legionella yabuuchiae]
MDYKNKKVLLASKHKKEQAISDVFLNKLGCEIHVEAFDTDQFGTFTGEIPRATSPYETCVLKANKGAEVHGYDLSLASEGSFGPHPFIPFIACDHEIMVFVDRKNKWTIAEQLTTEKTNYKMIIIDRNTELNDFIDQVGFPSHALTLQTNHSKTVIAKGINDINLLNTALRKGFKHEKKLLLATDMRAMVNPTRMKAIKTLAHKLSERIATTCPKCQTPGFGFKETTGNLPCSLCASPTSFYQKEILACIQCDFKHSQPRKDGLESADPTYCKFCNP